MKTKTKATSHDSVKVDTPAAPALWLDATDLATLRESISAETLHEVFEYHQRLWDVLCRAKGKSFYGHLESGQVGSINAFVRMLMADSLKFRGASLAAAEETQDAALRASCPLLTDPMWSLDSSEIIAFKE